MRTALSIGTCHAGPGQVATGSIPAGRRPDGLPIDIPVMVANGADDGPVVWIDGAIHGDEPEGPLAVITLFDELQPAKMRGAVVGVPVLNTMAFEACERGNPADTFAYDMNRIYPGRPDGFLTERVAHAHYLQMKEHADLEISIHSGGAHSFLAQAVLFPTGDPSLELAKALGPGWNLLFRSFASKGSPPAMMSQAGKAAVTIELGGLCETHPDRYLHNGRVLADTLLNVLRHYHVVDGTARYEKRWTVGSADVMLVQQAGLWRPEPNIPLRQPVAKGTVVAKVLSYTGNVLEEVRAPADCVIFGIRTRPPVFAGEWVVFYSIIEGEIAA